MAPVREQVVCALIYLPFLQQLFAQRLWGEPPENTVSKWLLKPFPTIRSYTF